MVNQLLKAVCDDCWAKLNPKRTPYRVHHPEKTACAECGRKTTSGIYIALHPEMDVAE